MKYITNEDIKTISLNGEAAREIKAGSKCNIVEINDDIVTLKLEDGFTVVTEDHMIDEC